MRRPRKIGLVTTILALLAAVFADEHPFKGHARYRRQILDEPGQQIDLNITVPYIFSARLYTYGPNRGDIEMNGRQEIYKLESPVHFMGDVFDSIYIGRDGAVGFTEKRSRPSALPIEEPTIAVFWQPATLGKVYYRETDDINIINLAHNEVNIQYRYGSQFRVRSVVLITWEGVKDPQNLDSEGNTFQLALIMGDSMTFAHFIYSKLNYNQNAIAGFSNHQNFYSLPDSATQDAIQLADKSDIGIPGEWLFRIDSPHIYLCGAGFKGLECIESCGNSQWFNDCSRSCHCDGGDACDQENGRCPNGKCSPGWSGEPICDVDVDECKARTHHCPNEQPDCLNTPGSFLCLCFEYDEQRQMCKNSIPAPPSAPIPVDVIPMRPSFTRNQPTTTPAAVQRTRFKATTTAAAAATTTRPANIDFVETLPTPLLTTIPTTRPTTTEAPTTVIIACSRCDPNARCENGVCKCQEGFTGDGFRCYDVDECEIEGAVCGNHSICTNTIGSFECTCFGGYRLEDAQCVDVDECRETPRVCGEPGHGTQCINKDGSFECVCKEGFIGDPSTLCEDIDECKNPESCGPNSRCTNTPGGYECECLPGFERIAEGAHCTDRDECAVSPCHPAAICSNTRGSYNCECIDGFIGDGKTCHETIMYPISNDSRVIPRSWNSVTMIPLIEPVSLFGKKYNSAFISTNGLISFATPLDGLVERVETINQPAIFALHAQLDYLKDGLVAYTYVNDTDSSTFPLLMRASLSVQSIMGLESYETKSMHIFTFDHVRQAGSDNFNSFQAVIAEAPEATFLFLIYEKAQAKGPLTGIATPNRFMMIPNDRLTRGSNVGQPGKWMYRVDTAELLVGPSRQSQFLQNFPFFECDSGRYGTNCEQSCHCDGSVACDVVTGACPGALCRAGWEGAACDQDIDECAMSLVTCSTGSECVNTRGGYRCDCKRGFVPVGKECRPTDPCLSKFGVPCSRNGECINLETGPQCSCHKGYSGDGFKCMLGKANRPIGNDLFSELTHHLMEATNENSTETTPNENPFLMKSWTTERPEIATRPKFATVRTPPLLYTAPPIKPVMHDKDVDVLEGSKEKVEEGDGIHLAFVILPAALIVIWALLILIVLVLCKMSKRKRESRERQNFPRSWKMPAIQSTNPNIIYGRTPRITTYDAF
ncbi:unnamed protein product [Caenorhabditis bovis]|uniref:EGF-like domain-containing protein n=1 Tax=Caenorhabditis bovis TaxID=2654633 RepID=A0A8S1EU21_9PELO|nr:unnamed protein product [Caenorhabditis bovis]